jgi:hypothetical protein
MINQARELALLSFDSKCLCLCRDLEQVRRIVGFVSPYSTAIVFRIFPHLRGFGIVFEIYKVLEKQQNKVNKKSVLDSLKN